MASEGIPSDEGEVTVRMKHDSETGEFTVYATILSVRSGVVMDEAMPSRTFKSEREAQEAFDGLVTEYMPA